VSAYYNEIDPYAVQWLRNLIAAGHIADGVVDDRSISEVEPDDLREFTQCHFFAGIGVWSHALRLAGWPDERPVWTGSCPCQPFSVAGRAGGFTDERHLWPHWHHLIKECRPGVVFGEQVASKDGLSWLDLVQADMEGEEYAIGAFDLCAAGFGAPHIRQRLYWVADGSGEQRNWGRNGGASGRVEPTNRSSPIRLADSLSSRRSGQRGGDKEKELRTSERSPVSGVAYADGKHSDAWGCGAGANSGQQSESPKLSRGDSAFYRCGPTNGYWRDADWLGCRDGKWRPVEPGTFPLAHGASARVGRLRAYGNAINPWQAEAFIAAYMAVMRVAA
jgi:DNA (cytosine-5)-methyltransferase 1